MQAYWFDRPKTKLSLNPLNKPKGGKKAVNSGGFGHSGAQGERQRQGHSNTCDNHKTCQYPAP